MTLDRQTAVDAVVVGLGQSGLAAVRHLRRQGQRVVVMDSRYEPPHAATLSREHPEVEQRLGELDATQLARADEIILSPGVDPRTPVLRHAADRGQPIAGEVELFARSVTAPVIAITGSNGKSTVTRMVGAMAAAAGVPAAVGGNLGPSALDLLAQRPDAPLFVLELSSFQLETTRSLQPLAATVLNLSPDHMDRYAGMADYAAAKARILRGADTAVLNARDPYVRAMQQSGQTTVWFASDGQAADWALADHGGEPWLLRQGEVFMARGELGLAGGHNTANALAALALGEAAGFAPEAMRHALARFRGLPHRAEPLGRHAGRDWVNDSKATNVGAAVAAIEGATAPVVLIAGGDGKGQSFTALASVMQRHGRCAVVYGQDREQLAAALEETISVQRTARLDEAVALALEASIPGDTIMLAPACASLDQFPDYQARGERFRQLVEALGDE